MSPDSTSSSGAENEQTFPKAATKHTAQLLAEAASSTGPLDPDDFERASRGLLATHQTGIIMGARGPAWDVATYDFLRTNNAAPDTVHPSLWRQAQLNAQHGLFEVAPGVWQARGYDISNITFMAGTAGWLVIDPLTSEATARACLALANEHLGERPVTAVIYTHSHSDHFGGVLGVTTHADVAEGRCRVIAPVGFLRETVAENVIAGPAMNRRSAYQFGATLPVGPRGHVDCGLGKALPTNPQLGLIAPTEDITFTGEELVVDGIRIIFQLTPETEAPAEMNFFFPDHGWLCTAENCSHTMHNLVPIRGTQVRNALAWSKYIGEALEMFGRQTTILFNSHNWPRWGTDDVCTYLSLQRDLYRWMHDQTMRLANKGLVATEIAESLQLPDIFRNNAHTREYYGTLVHNAKAVYQRYLSWYDANPAHLHAYPPSDAGQRYVEFMGGAAAVLEKARDSFAAGDYRWVVEVVNHLVFADPSNAEARHLQADALEQLGYQSESGTWRDSYLTGAQELRVGPPPAVQLRGQAFVLALTPDLMFDILAVRLRSENVDGVNVRVNWTFTDTGEQWILGLQNNAMHTVLGRHDVDAAATVTTTVNVLRGIFAGQTTFSEAISSGEITLTGDGGAMASLLDNLDTFSTGFAIVEP